MSDISVNNTRRTNLSDVSNNTLYNIVNELINRIEDDENLDTRDFNPFLYRIGNYTIGRSVSSASPLFNIINQIFDTSINSINTNQNVNQENNDDESIIEQITFQVTYPLIIPPNFGTSENPIHNNSPRNDNRNIQTISNEFGRTYRSYSSFPYDSFDYSSTGSLFQQILSRSLYDKRVYNKKISEKGKSQLIHVRFDKNNKDNINTSCPIMQTDFEEDQYLIKLPCNHIFIHDAINRWLDEKPECPVCRFQLDSIEVKIENDNLPQNIFTDSEPYVHQPIHMRYNDHYIDIREIVRDRIHLNDNSYIDYLYDGIDNDFQIALLLSYRELIDLSGNISQINDTNT